MSARLSRFRNSPAGTRELQESRHSSSKLIVNGLYFSLSRMTDGESGSRYETFGVPGLLRRARNAYGNLIRQEFADAGFDDMPRHGAYVLARVYGGISAPADLTRDLGISKQAVSQLIDTMVMRGYLERTPDAEDRRRMALSLSPRGEAAATAGWQAATQADAELASRLSPDGVAALRAGLITLCQMADESDAAGPGEHSHGEHSHGEHSHSEHSHSEHSHSEHSHSEHRHEHHNHDHGT